MNLKHLHVAIKRCRVIPETVKTEHRSSIFEEPITARVVDSIAECCLGEHLRIREGCGIGEMVYGYHTFIGFFWILCETVGSLPVSRDMRSRLNEISRASHFVMYFKPLCLIAVDRGQSVCEWFISFEFTQERSG